VLTIQRVNPLEVAESLKSLFATESAALAAVVDRAYPDYARTGGASWVGVDSAGHVQLNVTLVPHEYDFRGRTVRAGMLANEVAGKNYRWFFPAVSLVKQLVRDVSREVDVDFLCADPQPTAAAVSKAAGLDELGAMDRFVIPLTDVRRPCAIAARAYSTALRLRFGLGAARCTIVDATEYDLERFGSPRGTSTRVRPYHSASMYRRRLEGYPGPDYVWCEFRSRGARSGDADAAVLLQDLIDRRVAHVWTIRRAPGVGLQALIPGLIRVARERGAHRLEVEAVRGSALAGELLHIGFRQRRDLVPLFGKAITAAGAAVLGAIQDWEITAFDMDR
jgi:hypothetical protein